MSDQPLAKVRYRFTSRGDQGTAWRVVRLRVREGLSDLFSCTLELASDALHANPDAMLGAACELSMERGPLVRRLHGIVHRVEHTGIQGGHLLSRVHVVPALWALSQRIDSRIFQDKTVPEVLATVLNQGLGPYERSHRLELQRDYPKREYCVQYQETDLDFVLRLMEEEGIAFYFDHSGEAEALVLVDANEAFHPCETLTGGAIPIAGPEAGTHVTETVRMFDWRHELRTTSVVVRDFDWTQPALDLTRQARGQDGRGLEREHYLYPALTPWGYDEGARRYAREEGGTQAELRRQAYQARERRGLGGGSVTGFLPGHTFELTGHGRPELDQRYLLTRVEHFGEAPEELPGDTLPPGAGAPERYENRFECIPLSVTFRPERRTPGPLLSGAQTATVVGPSGEEIWTDAHGRIKVQFHWDREGKRDEHSSCWVRVAQVWGGAGWGFLFVPRVGMEVVVEFLEGNPDRPLVLGCVYNGQYPPPYALPDQKTRSTLKTQSTPGGGGSNELRFEDAAGQEEVFLHAQKDLNEAIENDHSTTVTKNQTNTVKGDQTNSVSGKQDESIGGDQSMTVTGKRTKTIVKDEEVKISGSRDATITGSDTATVQRGRTGTVTGLEKLELNGGRDATVTGQEVLTVNGTRETRIQSTDLLEITGDFTTRALANASVFVANAYDLTANTCQLNFNNGTALLSSSGAMTISNLSGDLNLGCGGGAMFINAARELTIGCGGASIKLEANGKVTISGDTLTLLGNKTELSVQSSNVTLEPTKVSINGRTISSSAQEDHAITGGLVRIN